MPLIFKILAAVMSIAALTVFLFVFRQIRREWKKEREASNRENEPKS